MWHIWFILISCVQVIVCCRFGPELNCGFPCKCTGSNLCDPETGVCAPGSQCQNTVPAIYTRIGPGCIIGNVAYEKSNVQQSGQYDYYSAELAVDGDTTPHITSYPGESCAHPMGLPYAWWWMDLGGLYNIQSITIVNRLAAPRTSQPQSRFNDISTDYDIKIGNTADRSSQTLCVHQNKTGNQIQPVETLACYGGDISGRYISFTRTGGTAPNIAVICEFIVMGHKYIECSSNFCTGSCDPVIGCDACAAGKMLPDCQQDCPDGYWGVNCANQCGMCNHDNACDKVTGSCGEGCNGWYLPDMCTKMLGTPPVTLRRKVTHVTENSATVNWDRPNGYDNDTQPYFFFIVRYGINDSDVADWFESEMLYLSDVNNISFAYLLTNLMYNTKYGVQISSYRELDIMTDAGESATIGFKTRCIAPTKPLPVSVTGSADLFKVFWKVVGPSGSGCDHVEQLQVSVECHNLTHTTNSATDLPPTETEFLYSSAKASKCAVWLAVTNNEGLSAVGDIVTLSVQTTTGPLITPVQTQPQSPGVTDIVISNSLNSPEDDLLNIPAIAIGASLGACVLGLITVVIMLILRLRKAHNKTLEGNQDSVKPSYGTGQRNQVPDAKDGAEKKQTNTEYESVDNVHGEPVQTGAKVNKPAEDHVIYENTHTSQYETINQGFRSTMETVSSVYQELK